MGRGQPGLTAAIGALSRCAPMPDQPNPAPKPGQPTDPRVYGGQWGPGDKDQKPAGPPPLDRPDKIEPPPEAPAQQASQQDSQGPSTIEAAAS